MYLWNRRDFMKASAMGLAVTATGSLGWPPPPAARVSLVHVGSGGRDAAIRKAVNLVGAPEISGKSVALKPNFNSAHVFPGSTHPDTLSSLVGFLKELGAQEITVPDRSGMGDSREVMEEKGVFQMAEALGFRALPLQDLPAEEWIHIEHPDLHWEQGFHLARIYREVDAIIQTCCVKTHGFGGHFTLSLKNTVGMVAKRVPGIEHDFMTELHRSRRQFQRHMIAELNLAYRPELIVMDAVDCLTDRGPHEGTVAHPNVILASTDRVAIDAVGVAILREKGTTEEVSHGTVFQQEQIARAGELGIGVDSTDKIEIVTVDSQGQRYAEQLRAILQPIA